ncbi:MAG: L-histidine N(alpha)-methyltransferase [Vicinamibacterales bacterium]
MSAVSKLTTAAAPPWLAPDVHEYLMRRPRQLPSHALYDALGSALFDAICALPWYRVTRAERGLFVNRGAEILRAAGALTRIVELGCGSGEKLDRLLEASAAEPAFQSLTRIDLVDVSASALAAATRLLDMRWSVQVVPHRHPYEPGLHEATAARTRDDRIGVLFLGSNVGNFDPPGMRAFFTGVREALKPGDALLISADLVKPERDLLLAYDDPLGVTAAFNKNLLVRLNRDLRANFDLAQFDHRAVWNARESRVEMHLVSRRRQRIDVPEADVSLWLDEGEAIWTESSYKYTADAFEATLARAGFAPEHRWLDEEAQFVVVLARVR